MIHQTCRIAVKWYYLGWCFIWVILAEMFMLINDIINARIVGIGHIMTFNEICNDYVL